MCPYRLLTTHHPVPPFQPTLTRPDTTDRACCILAPPCTLPQSGAGWAPLRWLLAYWAGVHGSVHLADWDESDAFCNIPREDLPALLDDTAPGLGAWLQQFYGSLQIRSSTPYGLTEPFPMIHGGGQGDSGGVGAYLAVGIQRTLCHRGLHLHGLDPRCPTRPTPEPCPAHLRAPHDPSRPVLELCYSDDRRPVAATADGLELLLETMYHTCWAAGGTVNGSKLQAFRVDLRHGRLSYGTGAINTLLGRIPLRRGGLLLAGVPLLMGERPSAALEKTLRRLRAIHTATRRLRPSFILTLRILLGFAVSQLDYTHDACPPHPAGLQPLQTTLDATALSALRAPRSFPKALLYSPLQRGGFGVPHLLHRLHLRFLLGVLKALDSRNALARRSTRHLFTHPTLLPVAGGDLLALHTLLAEHDLHISVPPHPDVLAAPELTQLLAPYQGGPVLLVSDGSSPPGCIGWGAVVATTTGELLAARSSPCTPLHRQVDGRGGGGGTGGCLYLLHLLMAACPPSSIPPCHPSRPLVPTCPCPPAGACSWTSRRPGPRNGAVSWQPSD